MRLVRPDWSKHPYQEPVVLPPSAHLKSLRRYSKRYECGPVLKFPTIDTTPPPPSKDEVQFGIESGCPIRPSISNKLGTPEDPPTLISLPPEILLTIMSHLFDDQISNQALTWIEEATSRTLSSLLRTNALLNGIALDWIFHRKITIQNYTFRGLRHHHRTLLQNIGYVRFDLTYLGTRRPSPTNTLALFLERVHEIWGEKHRLTNVEIYVPAVPPKQPWAYFPDILPPPTKKTWLLSVFRPLTEFFKTEGINYSVKIDTSKCGIALDQLKDPFGSTALNWAAAAGDDTLLEQALQTSAHLADEPNNSGDTPLFNAAWLGSPRTVEQLLKTRQVDVNIRCWLDLTPLAAAIMTQDLEAVQLLLNDAEVAPDTFMSDIRPSALWYAATVNNLQIVNLMLQDRTLNVNITDQFGRTPLHATIAENGDDAVDVVKALIEWADPCIADQEGRTPLSLAKERGCTAVVMALQHSFLPGH